ncbi:hypothetical protein psyc5s11_08900 [Clostridium gelidum]|uniref:Uncharacterized protein n=1 Tax=Clostridium gelidum TaxID=704125 RepID=A0ABN6ITV2_9CLOT|nr:DUF6483 family protein [Clostridium gelidum]BCZ44823.1 hypothetical protein psyc5s11_08900 [Clostridium gelidum]
MDIEKLIEEFAMAFAKVLFNKEEKKSEKINIDQISSTDIFKIIFNKSFHRGDYSKAEDLIFHELENNNSTEVYEVASEFYNTLLKKSDEELNKRNFPRKEIYQGLDDIKRFKINL